MVDIMTAPATSAVRLIMLSLVQFDCDGHQSETKHNGIGAEPPGQDDGSNKGSEDQQRTVDHGCETTEHKPPTAVIAARTDGSAQHQPAGEYRPGAHEEDEADDRDGRPQECECSRNDVDDALEYQKPPPFVPPRGAHRRDDCEGTVDESISRKHQHQRQHGDAGLEDRDQAKNNSEYAPDREGPPILSQQLCDVLFRGIFVRACRNRSLEGGPHVLSGGGDLPVVRPAGLELQVLNYRS